MQNSGKRITLLFYLNNSLDQDGGLLVVLLITCVIYGHLITLSVKQICYYKTANTKSSHFFSLSWIRFIYEAFQEA